MEAVAAVMASEGVDTVFGIPGAAILPLYAALRKSGIKHLTVRRGEGGTHAADDRHTGYLQTSQAPRVFREINRSFGPTTFVTAIGLYQIWSGQSQRTFEPRRYMVCGQAGPLGCQVPAASASRVHSRISRWSL